MLSPDHLNLFEEYMNTCHSSISFTSETELENVMTFLDFEFNRKNNEFVSSVYRKATFTGVYTHFESLIPLNYKRGFVSTLIYLIFHICSSFEIIVKELTNFKSMMTKNGYHILKYLLVFQQIILLQRENSHG